MECGIQKRDFARFRTLQRIFKIALQLAFCWFASVDPNYAQPKIMVREGLAVELGSLYESIVSHRALTILPADPRYVSFGSIRIPDRVRKMFRLENTVNLERLSSQRAHR